MAMAAQQHNSTTATAAAQDELQGIENGESSSLASPINDSETGQACKQRAHWRTRHKDIVR
jgi:hypothetical protein